jgi:hypothetical protein
MGFTERTQRASAVPRNVLHLGGTPQRPDARWNIATASNQAYAGLLLNWLFHLRAHAGSVRALALVADDLWTLDFLRTLQPRLRAALSCENVSISWGGSNVSKATTYAKASYKMLMAARPLQLLGLLSSAADSTPWVWADVDALILDSPFCEMPFGDHAEYDIHQLMGEPRHCTGRLTREPRVCAGFMAMRNIPAVRTLLRGWADDMASKVQSSTIKWEGNQNSYRKLYLHHKRDLRVRALPGDRFLNGNAFFLNRSRWPLALVAHATHSAGARHKIELFKHAGVWRCKEAARWLDLSEGALCDAPAQHGGNKLRSLK